MVVGKLIAHVHIVGSFLLRLIGINSGLDERRFGVQGKSRKGDQCCSMDGSEGRPLHLEWKTTRIMVLVGFKATCSAAWDIHKNAVSCTVDLCLSG